MRKIYKVEDGKMYETDIIKETKKMFSVERGIASGYSAQINKEYAVLTPEDAVTKYVGDLRSRIAYNKRMNLIHNENIARAEKLIHSHKKEAAQ